jgi:PadR family transcriptional regulator PadR
MRGRPSGLLPLERSIIETGLRLRSQGTPEFHGFMAAAEIRTEADSRLLTARGTLYKALDRLEKRGFLTSHWEDADNAVEEGRPRRRLYAVTAAGEVALATDNTTRPAKQLVQRAAES